MERRYLNVKDYDNFQERIYLTPQEVCKYLRISRSLLYYWLSRNDFVASIKFGKFTRFVKTEIDDWMMRHKEKKTNYEEKVENG